MQNRKKVSQAYINRVRNDALNEIWKGVGSYLTFQKRHLNSLDTELPKINPSGNPVLPPNFSSWKPEVKIEYVRKYLSDDIREYVEDLLEKKGIQLPSQTIENAKEPSLKKPKRKPRKSEKPTGMRPKPNPKPPTDPDDGTNPEPPSEPEPRPTYTVIPPKIDDRKKPWNSRVGYFVSISDIQAHTEDLDIYASPNIDFNFQSHPNEVLELKAGDSWQSDWIDSGVIRGLDVGVIGKYRLNHINNGDFEV